MDISQGSVATYLRCDGIFKYGFVANLPLSKPVKECENRLTFGEIMGKSLVSCFLTHGVVVLMSYSQLYLPASSNVHPPFNAWFPGPTQVCSCNDILVGSVTFAGLTCVPHSHRYTDH